MGKPRTQERDRFGKFLPSDPDLASARRIGTDLVIAGMQIAYGAGKYYVAIETEEKSVWHRISVEKFSVEIGKETGLMAEFAFWERLAELAGHQMKRLDEALHRGT